GAVYLAEHERLRRKVAIKVLTPPKQDANGKLTVARFLREARAAAALDHPNIVRIHDVALHAEVHYLVMEYVEGETLDALAGKVGQLPPSRAVGYIAQAAAGLQHASDKGFVHRDIKPSNLILSKEGIVKILDMGLARCSTEQADNLTEVYDAGAIVGTADFIAPEQAMNHPSIDIRADIYSLGATFFALVTGRPPFGGNTTQKLIQHQMKEAPSLLDLDKTVPVELAAVVEKMLAKKPEQRYRTPAEVIAALAPWLNDDGGKVVAGLCTSSSSSVAMQNTLTHLAAHSTNRLNKTSKQVAQTPNERRGLSTPKKIALACGGLVALAVGLGYFALGSSKDGAAVTPANPSRGSQVTGTNPTSIGAAPNASTTTGAATNGETTAPPHTAKRVYNLDLNRIADGAFTMQSLSTVIKGSYPKAPALHQFQCWAKGSVGEFFIGTYEGSRALGMVTTEGESGAQLCVEMESIPDVILKPGQEYDLRIEYRHRGTISGHLAIQNHKYDLIAGLPLNNTGNHWHSSAIRFNRPANQTLRIAVDGNKGTADSMLYVRKLEIVEVQNH
ncbi:MAG: serine/threonine-protein kinase, partial [Gemmataceae bacterium]